jgi:hypothetical protein
MTIIEASFVKVSGTLADGTLRMVFDVEPRHAQAAFALFNSPGTPAGLARLQNQPVYEYPETEHKPVGPLCMLAVQWCKDEMFWEWLNQLDGVNGDISSEEEAKDIILVYLDIDSRKQIDDNGPIAEEFHETFRKPFMAWLEKNG